MFLGVFLNLYHPSSYVNQRGIYGGPKLCLSACMGNHFNFARGGAVFFFLVLSICPLPMSKHASEWDP
mgnify:FL=1